MQVIIIGRHRSLIVIRAKISTAFFELQTLTLDKSYISFETFDRRRPVVTIFYCDRIILISLGQLSLFATTRNYSGRKEKHDNKKKKKKIKKRKKFSLAD